MKLLPDGTTRVCSSKNNKYEKKNQHKSSSEMWAAGTWRSVFKSSRKAAVAKLVRLVVRVSEDNVMSREDELEANLR